jgi:hypothetical protein
MHAWGAAGSAALLQSVLLTEHVVLCNPQSQLLDMPGPCHIST